MTTLEAIDGSIEKWKKNANISNLEDARLTPDDCPLCQKFYHKEGDFYSSIDGLCGNCPIRQFMGIGHCQYTPYEEAAEAEGEGDLQGFLAAAQKEVEFLEKVRKDFLDNYDEND